MRFFQRVAHAFGGLLFLALFAVFLVQIGARFGFNKPLTWTDEGAVILYLWVILWAAALMVPEHEHVAFDLLWNAVGPRGQRIMYVLGHLILGGLALVGLPATWDYVHFMAREGTPVLNVPLMVVYLPFALLMLALVVRSCWAVWCALRGDELRAGRKS